MSGFMQIFKRSVIQLTGRPIYWAAMFVLPLFLMLMLTNMMESGLPDKVPAAIVDKDGTALSREITQNLGSMQMVDLVDQSNSYTEARHKMQEGKIFGFFMIPENFEQDLLSGKGPTITFYTNMTYFVPASLLFKSFKTTALMSKAGIMLNVAETAGLSADEVVPMMQPVNIVSRGLGNPGLNYAIYLCNSFVPCVFQLMIMLMVCFSLGEEIKYGTSPKLLQMAGGNIYKAIAAKILPQTIGWWIMILFMESWLYFWQGYPMHGSWWWFTISELMYVVACQAMAVFFFGVLPNLRFSLSVCSLLGILSFSLAAFSFPVESMYGAIAIFSYVMPIRYNFLIYIDQALNGIDIWYSRWWYVAYIVYMLLPLTLMWRIKKEFARPVYIP
ncbi:MAG: ABC transporter permease [Muribaculaceae bacterium]|nr:ABC transporter permease [Muribaculaceae bacterium]MDE6632931.1 ABC transporter permease [Muribaculaceae bacterium]